MRGASTLLILVIAATSACNRQQPQPANNTVASNQIADIETLPADESDSTPTNQLESGDDNPDVNMTLNHD
jgi:hypothetical protein